MTTPTYQKHYPDLGSDTLSDVISRGRKPVGGVAKCRQFPQARQTPVFSFSVFLFFSSPSSLFVVILIRLRTSCIGSCQITAIIQDNLHLSAPKVIVPIAGSLVRVLGKFWWLRRRNAVRRGMFSCDGGSVAKIFPELA